ncbi:MAG: PEP-CTERM sorting domain-containing protein [Planctomycetia bacterium]
MFKQFQTALLGAAALIAGPATAGTINWGTFGGVKAEYKNVTESGQDVVPPATGLFVPQTPSYTENPNPQLTFLPSNFVETDQNVIFDLKHKSALLAFAVAAKPLVGDPDYVGFAMTGNTLNVAGTYSVWAPFGAGDMGAGSPASIAKVTMAGNYTIQVTGVNWLPYSGGTAINRSMTIVPSDVTVTGPQNSATTGNWSGTSAIDWNDVRVAAGIGSGDYITELSIQFTADIAAAGVYGNARTTLTNFNAINPVEPIAVPEPPTLVLAGLGAAAAVGHGYRRRKLRQSASESVVTGDDDGAIALTA